jgi:hypothetical protein
VILREWPWPLDNTSPKMAQSHSEKEAAIQIAKDTWRNNPGRPLTDIAREHDVSFWAFRRRVRGVPSKSTGGGLNKKLTLDGEQALI